MPPQTNYDLLVQAGMVNPSADLKRDDRRLIDEIDRGDLEAMIRIWQSLPEDFKERMSKSLLIF